MMHMSKRTRSPTRGAFPTSPYASQGYGHPTFTTHTPYSTIPRIPGPPPPQEFYAPMYEMVQPRPYRSPRLGAVAPPPYSATPTPYGMGEMDDFVYGTPEWAFPRQYPATHASPYAATESSPLQGDSARYSPEISSQSSDHKTADGDTLSSPNAVQSYLLNIDPSSVILPAGEVHLPLRFEQGILYISYEMVFELSGSVPPPQYDIMPPPVSTSRIFMGQLPFTLTTAMLNAITLVFCDGVVLQNVEVHRDYRGYFKGCLHGICRSEEEQSVMNMHKCIVFGRHGMFVARTKAEAEVMVAYTEALCDGEVPNDVPRRAISMELPKGKKPFSAKRTSRRHY